MLDNGECHTKTSILPACDENKFFWTFCRGKREFSTGRIYEGGWQDNMFHGYGTIKYTNGHSWSGTFIYHKKKRKVEYEKPADWSCRYNKYYMDDGKCHTLDSNLPTCSPSEDFWTFCRGKRFFVGGIYYEGGFQNNQFHGEGSLKKPDGTHWTGVFIYNERHRKTSGMDDFSLYSNGNFDGQNFSDANLENKNFKRSRMMNASFKRANLSNANFSRTWASNANFAGANMSGINLSRSDLWGASFQDAILVNAQIQNVSFYNPSGSANVFKNADITGADFSGSNLTGLNLAQTTIFNTKFERSNLSGTSFKEKICPI